MTKPFPQRDNPLASSPCWGLPFSKVVAGVSVVLTAALLVAWMPAASAKPFIRVQNNSYPNSGAAINFPPVVPFGGSVYSPVQTIVQPGFGSGLSVQIGTPGYYQSGNDPAPSGYYRQFRNGQYRGNVNHSVLINPTVINSPIRNSTLVNPTIVTTPYAPYYPAPYYNTQTVTTTRPEPEVYIDPQYGVRYRSPSATSVQPIIVYPQITYPQINP